MTELIGFMGLLGLGCSLLGLILFFKIWGMTNDISKIKELLEREVRSHTKPTNSPQRQTPTSGTLDGGTVNDQSSTLQPGAIVVVKKTGIRMKVKEIVGNQRIVCVTPYNDSKEYYYGFSDIEEKEEEKTIKQE